MASSENSKTAANQRDHSYHCIPSIARAVMPPKVGVISAAPCTTYTTTFQEFFFVRFQIFTASMFKNVIFWVLIWRSVTG